MIIIIDDHTVAVETETDLRNVVSVGGSTNITNVHLANDIKVENGITINPARTILIIDGEYPIGSGIFNTYRDSHSESEAVTLGVRAASNINITMRNMNMECENWYGVPYILNSTTTRGVTVTYENIIFSGRQITFNCQGTTRYIDCDITIHDIPPSWTAEEAGEVAHVEIGGKTTITKNAMTDPLFQFWGASGYNSFKILENADVTINASYYFMYVINTGGTIPFTIEDGASLKMTIGQGIGYTDSHRVGDFYVGKNAEFDFQQLSQRGTYSMMSMTGTLTVMDNARFVMRADFTGSVPLIRFRTNAAQNNLNIQNPQYFVLYKYGSNVINFEYQRPFYISGEQVNYWMNPADFSSAGTFDDPPLYHWHNGDWKYFYVSGNVQSTTSNISSDLVDPSPSLINMQLQSVSAFAVGYIPLTVEQILDDGEPVKGKTAPGAELIIEYTDSSGTHTIEDIFADANGNFSVDTENPIPEGTKVYVSVNKFFMYKKIEIEVAATGELYIESSPDYITYKVPPLSPSPTLILGRSKNEPVVVIDKRFNSTQWELLVMLEGPMKTVTDIPLQGEVVYVPEEGPFADMEPLPVGIKKHVYTGGPYVERTNVNWVNSCGMLLHLTGPVHLGVEYLSRLQWSVRPIE